jgi:hypothetical protein
MRSTRGRVLAAVAMAGVTLVVLRPRAESVVADLGSAFDTAKMQPGPSAFEITEIEIDGRSARAVVARGQTRLTMHVTVPEGADTLRITYGLSPEVSQAGGDGVLFLIAVSDGLSFREKLAEVVEPVDRRWHKAEVDIREYAGLTVAIILNTRAGASPSANTTNDVAVWARPVFLSR